MGRTPKSFREKLNNLIIEELKRDGSSLSEILSVLSTMPKSFKKEIQEKLNKIIEG